MYLLEKASRIIGVYVLVPTRPETLELMNIAVDEDYQGQGFGKQMVEHATAAAKEQGYKIMDVGTASLGVEQLMFYQKCGFRMTSIDHGFFVKHYDESIIINGILLRDMVRLSMEL
ncbi:GNAT family N-acetyltransferase [Salinicoccus albus]|uniref:GNAT family N-acetyltransferase n=1 Tax=Salinicoccus albus TaxID=418756 RepID=UPI000379FEFD